MKRVQLHLMVVALLITGMFAVPVPATAYDEMENNGLHDNEMDEKHDNELFEDANGTGWSEYERDPLWESNEELYDESGWFDSEDEDDGWVMIAYDYDQDGQVDAYEYIHIYDLQRARQMSRQRPQGRDRTQVRQAPGVRRQRSQAQQPRRQQQLQAGPPRSRQWLQTDRQRGMPAAGQRMQVSGTIRETRQITLAGQQQAHKFAKVRTQDGRTVVIDLGPARQVNQLNLSQGDRIQVQGEVAMVNERPVLMAGQVQANDQTITPQRPRGTQTRRLEGMIVETATRRLEGPDQPAHVIALIELETGRRVPVDLGRQQDLEDVPVRRGKNVTLLVRPVRIGDRTILAAEQMGIDGERIEAQWLKETPQQQQQTQDQTRRQQAEAY